MERLMRLRQPAAVVALVALGLHALLLLLSTRTLPEDYELGYLASAVVEPVLMLLLTALLVTCWLDQATSFARGLTLAALVLTAMLLAVVVGLVVASALALPWPEGYELDFYWSLLPELTVAGISLAVQVALLRRPAAESISARQTEPIPLELGSEPEGEPAPDPELQPTWPSDQAVGTVWRRAGDVSPRTAATDWDAPGEAGGWWSAEPDRQPPPEPRSPSES